MLAILAVFLGLAAAQDDLQITRVTQLHPSVYAVEYAAPSPGHLVEAVEPDGGEAAILAGFAGGIVVHLDANVRHFRLRSGAHRSSDFPVETAKALALTVEPWAVDIRSTVSGIDVWNRTKLRWIGIVLPASEAGATAPRVLAALDLAPGERRRFSSDSVLTAILYSPTVFVGLKGDAMATGSVSPDSGTSEDGWSFNTRPIRFNHASVFAGIVEGTNLTPEFKKPRVSPSGQQSFKADFDEFDVKGIEGGIEADLNLLRVSVGGFIGDWDAKDDGEPALFGFGYSADGKLKGGYLALYWPAVGYRRSFLGAHIGPDVRGYYTKADSGEVRTIVFPISLENPGTIMYATVGGRLGVELDLSPVHIGIEMASGRSFGDLEDGWVSEYRFGIRLPF